MTDFRSTAPISTTKPTMAKLVFGRLSQAWKGEAADFTPLLAEQLDALGDAIGVDLSSIGETEVPPLLVGASTSSRRSRGKARSSSRISTGLGTTII